MVHASITMYIPVGKRHEILSFLTTATQKIRFEPGCIQSHLYHDGEMAEGVLIDALWSDEESLNSHLRSPEFFNIMLIAELSSQPPEFRFETVQITSGIEAIEKARMAQTGMVSSSNAL